MTITNEVLERVGTKDRATLRHDAVAAIRAEARCTEAQAADTLVWVERFVCAARDQGYGVVYPTPSDMSGPSYYIFHGIVGHGSVARPGSAHEKVELAVLDYSRDEYALRHDVTDDSRHYCTVTVCLSVVR
jgi:hypothetical protein